MKRISRFDEDVVGGKGDRQPNREHYTELQNHRADVCRPAFE